MKHLIVRSDKSEGEVIRGIVVQKLTTDRHEASCSLSTTAELFVEMSAL